jgi:hypothetical protein
LEVVVMDKGFLFTAIKDSDEKVCKDCLCLLLSAHAAPVFGAAKPIEHEVAAFRALQSIGVLSPRPDEYELVTVLRVTKPKARALLYQVALRSMPTASSVDDQLRALLIRPTVLKDGDAVLIEVPDPFQMDMLRQRVRQLGYLSDGSFSGSIARIPFRALSALVADLIPENAQADVKKALRDQGIPGPDLTALVSGALARMGDHVAGPAGGQIGEYLGDLLTDSAKRAYYWLSKEGEE